MNFQPPEQDDPRDDDQRLQEAELEAHRVRFEQRFYADFGFEPLRLSYGYVEQIALSAWQAYQWALQDADRAQRTTNQNIDLPVRYGGCPACGSANCVARSCTQRAAPGGEAAVRQSAQPVAEALIREIKEAVRSKPTAVNGYNIRLWDKIEEKLTAVLTATPQPVEVQPVAWRSPSDGDWVNIVNHPRVIDDLNTREDAVDEAVKLTEAKCRELNANPQPVAREPMSWDEVVKGADEHFMIGNPEQVCTFDKGVKYAERHHGIKPTSAEGGE